MVEEKRQCESLFHQRFNIEVGIEETRQRFINRVTNMIEGNFPALEVKMVDSHKPSYVREALVNVATRLGVGYDWRKLFHSYAKTDFYSCLLSLEALYQTYTSKPEYYEYAEKVKHSIQYAISLNEIDIGIEWRNGVFRLTGAKLLDEALINKNLKWLADKGYHDVLIPFDKGLLHFLEAMQKPERLWDTVTDVYEAVEALAKRVTGRDTDLSANAQLFISKLKLSGYYKKMLKDYIDYANEYSRHATKLGKEKKLLLRGEVEAFIYTSGLFIRLAIQQLSSE